MTPKSVKALRKTNRNLGTMLLSPAGIRMRISRVTAVVTWILQYGSTIFSQSFMGYTAYIISAHYVTFILKNK